MYVIKDLRGRSRLNENFSLDTGLSADAIQGIGAPIIVNEPNNDSNPSSLIGREAFISSCALLKNHRYPPYVFNQTHQQNIVAQFTVFLIQYNVSDF